MWTPNQRRSPVAAIVLMLLGTACRDAPTAPTAPQPGSIRVSVQTSGGDPDNDGYIVVVASEVRRFVSSQSATVIGGISAGTHTVALEGVAANCTVSGTHPLSVTVPAGQTVDVAFAIVCATTGIEITTRTTGSDTLFGYQLEVDIQSSGSIGANSSRVVSRLPPGTHTVSLAMPGDHCSVSGGRATTVEVSNRKVTPVLFEITCVALIRLEKIAYVVDNPANPPESRIALVNPDGSGAMDLGFGRSPAWSPDGTVLAFSVTECDFYYGYGCSDDLVMMDPETHSLITLNEVAHGSSPAWAPTGDVIAFSDNRFQLYMVRLDGSRAVRLPIPGVSEVHHPTWSPDGRRIAFQCIVAAGNYDVCVVNRDGTGLVRLTSDDATQGSPAWSPDGRRIAFTTSSPQSQLALMAADGSSVTRLTDGFDPAWSRDGAKLVFARDDGLFTIDVDGANLKRLTTGKPYAPAWRPQRCALVQC